MQKETADSILAWHKRVEDRLRLPPMGAQYVARFSNQVRGSGSYPFGINMDLGGVWDQLHSDLQRLDEFMKER